jgi:formate hydrogenlyase subunit 4
MLSALANVTALLVMPFLLIGVLNRVKSLWSGRKGPPIWQSLHDVRRLLRKSSVYSSTTTPLFRIAPCVWLICAAAGGLVTPVLGARPLLAFDFDFVWLFYVWALGRVALMLAALDTGSSFEGMGAAREATFSTLLEPAMFLIAGALCLSSGSHTLHQALLVHLSGGGALIVWVSALAGLLIVLQVETARLPVDDPATHLELTMLHEVMVLDHSGPDLALVQLGAALKLYVVSAMIATLLNPWAGTFEPISCLANLALSLLVALLLGSVESLMARFKLRAVPQYIAVALASGVIALLAAAWRAGGST